ncbi:MAG: YggS family pyridoxal phosphate-dependent enzyme, partial [Oscillospiraceae bacterium]|nr:YggS family pyridoxal phosphate-dependent enzyme [Candidatus Equicaccousia limihippi]
MENIANAPAKNGDVIFLAATKTVDAKTVNEAIDLGLSYIGENRVQEFLQKNDDINKKAHRHFIGHLQTNKVKDIVGKVELIHSVDSYKLAVEIDKQSKKLGIITDILLEINIGAEDSKSGFFESELEENLLKIAKLDNVRVMGLMCVPPICNQKEENRKYFSKMYKIFVDIKGKKIDNSNM